MSEKPLIDMERIRVALQSCKGMRRGSLLAAF